MSHPVFFLQDLGESIAQGLPVSRHRDDGGVPQFIVNVKDLEKLYINHELEQVRLSNTASIHRYRLRKNDVVIAIRGSLLKSSVVIEASQESVAGQNVAFFRPKNLNQVNPGYIAVLMRSKWMEQTVYTLKKRSSTTLPSIRVSELRELKIPLPEIKVQNQIAQLFLSLEHYKELTIDALLARQELTEIALCHLLEK
jgi:type I restriction enzyme M protein